MSCARYKLESFGLSDPGLVRENNEDVWAEIPEKQFYVLADGMGGHNAGEVAAKVAVSSLCQSMRHLPPLQDQLLPFFKYAIAKANREVYNLSLQQEALQGMGTTLCSMLLYEHILLYAHVGDSRIYRYRQSSLTRLTQDHSASAKRPFVPLVRSKQPLTRALGTCPRVDADIVQGEIQKEDIYFLCSDGLTDLVSDEQICQILHQTDGIPNACNELIRAAKDSSGYDNITIVMISLQ